MMLDDRREAGPLGMFDLLEDLEAVIPSYYGVQLRDLLREQHQPVVAARSSDKGSPF